MSGKFGDTGSSCHRKMEYAVYNTGFPFERHNEYVWFQKLPVMHCRE